MRLFFDGLSFDMMMIVKKEIAWAVNFVAVQVCLAALLPPLTSLIYEVQSVQHEFDSSG